jgi:two-component system response regulator DesR
MNEQMRVILADDQASVRSALRLLLAQEPGLDVVAETADATALLQTAVETTPDLVLLDWELPGLPGAQLLRLLRYERPLLTVVAMSSRPEAQQEALDAHVDAFVSKSESPQRVLSAIRGPLKRRRNHGTNVDTVC